jgi:hypothetical protein
MPGPATVPNGNVSLILVLNATLSPTSVTGGVTGEQIFTVSGLKVGDFVDVNVPQSQAYISIGNTRVSANNSLAIEFYNASTATITPTAASVYTVFVARYENYAENSSAPTGIVG